MKKILALCSLIGVLFLSGCFSKENNNLGVITENFSHNFTDTKKDMDNTMMVDDVMEKNDTMKEVEDETMMKDDTTGSMIKDDTMKDTSEEESQKDTMMNKETGSTQGSYVAYAENMIGKTDNTVIFFHAGWCPSCRAADNTISGEVIPENLTLLKADYDSEIELRKKYGVVAQHTFVQVDANGDIIKKWAGGISVKDIEERL